MTALSHDYQQLIDIFAACFYASENTRLVAGKDEPYYLPAGQVLAEGDTMVGYHQVVFAHGFYASALHEIAHWCIAGSERRKQFDYGYWYAPDGRNAQQQSEFEQVERKPQALEWLFADAAGFPFQVSVDNLSGIEVDRAAFTAQVAKQKQAYLKQGLPSRAERFRQALLNYYQPALSLPENEAQLCYG